MIEEYIQRQQLELQEQEEMKLREIEYMEYFLQDVVENFIFPNSDKTLKERYPDVQVVKESFEGIYFSIANDQPKSLIYLIPQELL